MKSGESIKDFLGSLGTLTKLNSQFNVFERESYSGKPMPYNRRDFYKISLLLGKSRLLYADRGIEIDQPALVFSNPMIPYSWEPISEEQKGYFCLFTEHFIGSKEREFMFGESSLFRIGADPVYFVSEQTEKYISEIYQNMLREFHSHYIYKNELLKNHLELLIHEAWKMKPSTRYFKHANGSEKVVAMFLELLDRQFPVDSPQHALKLRSANEYAEALSVHPNHLNRAVKEITGMTTTDHITERIVGEAMELLRNTNWSIAEVAYSLGFDYPTYFNNYFKKQTGVTPRTLKSSDQFGRA